MGSQEGTSKGSDHFEGWLLSKFQAKTSIDKDSFNKEQIFEPRETAVFDKGGLSNDRQKSDNSSSKGHFPGILQSFVSCTKTRKKVASSNRFKCGKQLFTCTHFQNGNCRKYSRFAARRRVGNLTRPYRCILSHTNTPTVSEVSSLQCRRQIIPIHSLTLRNRYGSTRVHHGSKRGETDGSCRRHQDSSVHRRLVNESENKATMPREYPQVDSSCSKLGLDNKFRKIRFNSNSGNRVFGLQIRPQGGSCVSNSKENRSPSRKDSFHVESYSNISKGAHVTDWEHGFNGEDCTIGSSAYEASTVVPQDTLEVSSVSGYPSTSVSGSKTASSVVDQSLEPDEGFPTSSEGVQSPSIHRCFPKRLGGSFRASHSQWSVESGGVKTSHKHSRAKSSISSFKIIRKSASESKSADFHRQLFSGCLSEQTGRHPLSRNVCLNLENHGLDKCQGDPDSGKTHSRESQCLGRFSVKKRQGDSDRMGFESSSVQSNLPLLASTNGRFVCNKVESQATNVCVSCPRRSGLGNRCIEHLLGGSGRLCVLSSGSHTAGDSKDDHLQVQDNHDCPRVARDVLVLGSGGSVHETPSKASFVGESVDSTVQQQTSQQSGLFEPSCLASGVSPEGSRGFSEEVAKRIKEPQRHSSRRIYESRWSIFGKWCQENQVDISDPTIPNIANFLNYLFKEKALKPSTIAGYRTAIADGLGLKGEDVSKSLELNRLLSSFYRDKPVVNRSIPSWDLALVLQALTKRPFEPLGKASLKLLTFKTVFLLTLASGKRRGEIHAWTFSSLSYKENWSQVTIAPSTAFLAKNQLASDGPTVIKPVVIPALKPHLDSSLTQDRSLCPVRALKYYLDRTKDLRKNKNLLFVAIKEGFTRDISRATISSWLKQTILLAYEESDSETQQLCQVKAHDVRSMAASLAFKGGVSLSEILEACFWKSHNTFTNFYLKDLCWHNGQILKLGPIVSAQHVINL